MCSFKLYKRVKYWCHTDLSSIINTAKRIGKNTNFLKRRKIFLHQYLDVSTVIFVLTTSPERIKVTSIEFFRNMVTWKAFCEKEVASVTRFSKISPLWQKFTSLGQYFDILFPIGKSAEPT